MSLEESLAKLRQMSKERYGAQRDIMMNAVKEQRESGFLDNTIKVGDTLPEFALENTTGETIRSGDLLARGPVVLTVFRGHW